jgi:hypothetical protein
MPRKIEGRNVATEAELLKFANAVRIAGGANVIDALMPSSTCNPETCLIANALNFGCRVDTGLLGNYKGTSEPVWHMEFPWNMDNDRIAEIASKVPGARLRKKDVEGVRLERHVMQLPQHIGNAAWAFDRDLAFTEYAK